MKFDPHPITHEDYENLKKYCPLNSYKVVHPDGIPIPLSQSLKEKAIRAVIVGSGDQNNSVYMVNLLRKDSDAIDQQPLMIGMHSGDGVFDLTAGFVQHGDWTERTIYPGSGFFCAVEGSGIVAYYPYAGIPVKGSGDIRELEPDSHHSAFWNGIRLMKQGSENSITIV